MATSTHRYSYIQILSMHNELWWTHSGCFKTGNKRNQWQPPTDNHINLWLTWSSMHAEEWQPRTRTYIMWVHLLDSLPPQILCCSSLYALVVQLKDLGDLVWQTGGLVLWSHDPLWHLTNHTVSWLSTQYYDFIKSSWRILLWQFILCVCSSWSDSCETHGVVWWMASSM